MKKYILFTLVLLFLASCGTPQYLSAPTIYYPAIKNICTFNVQNLDNSARIEQSTLTSHYKDFDVQFFMQNLIPTLVIINNSNKSLIIDKSKSFILYDGYSTQLFKDVRSTRSTTFNNVQDAINNVQTSDASVSMSIPPYSKWTLPLEETNVKKLSKLPDFRRDAGLYQLSPYDNQECIEYVIPYTFDYSLSKWETCRNRIYIGSIEVINENLLNNESLTYSNVIIDHTPTYYVVMTKNGEPDFTEANYIDQQNAKIFRKHNAKVVASHIFWGFVTLPTIIGPWILWDLSLYCDSHRPTFYGNHPPYLPEN